MQQCRPVITSFLPDYINDILDEIRPWNDRHDNIEQLYDENMNTNHEEKRILKYHIHIIIINIINFHRMNKTKRIIEFKKYPKKKIMKKIINYLTLYDIILSDVHKTSENKLYVQVNYNNIHKFNDFKKNKNIICKEIFDLVK